MMLCDKQVNLSYYDQFGNLKIVLVNGNKLPGKQEVFSNSDNFDLKTVQS